MVKMVPGDHKVQQGRGGVILSQKPIGPWSRVMRHGCSGSFFPYIHAPKLAKGFQSVLPVPLPLLTLIESAFRVACHTRHVYLLDYEDLKLLTQGISIWFGRGFVKVVEGHVVREVSRDFTCPSLGFDVTLMIPETYLHTVRCTANRTSLTFQIINYIHYILTVTI